jgi:cytochrome P450
MAIWDLILSNPIISLNIFVFQFFLVRSILFIFFHPISHIPGPLLPKLTSLWLHYHAYIGDEATVIHAAHQKYGPLVRVSPNEVDISDPDAIHPIYVAQGGFPKADCYANFDIDGYKTIFSTTDSAHRAPRAKAIVPMFSTASIRANLGPLYACVDTMVQRMKDEASTGKPVNVLNLTRSLAVDAVTTHLFQQNYDGTSEKSKKLSVSAFVDAFVAVGRFFYLPNSVFHWVEWASEKIAPDQNTYSSMEVVDKYVDALVKNTTPDKNGNYPARLMELGLERTEVVSQCKDLIFAGTDSTGMNLATICRLLALDPKR